jgi:rod shape-determining protein MreC
MLKEKINELDRLKKLLNFKEAYNFKTIACNVIARNISNYVKFFIIDRGYKDNIELNDAIISYEGLVGKVIEIFPHSAKVQIILNVNSNVSIMNSRTRTTGILFGDGKGGLLVDYYDRLDKVKRGDIIISSGLGGVYPKGIPIGIVTEKILSDTGVFQKLKIKPNVNFYKLENVLVVKYVE